MRTAQIVYEFPSISETFVLSQINGLIDHGWDVRIFADSKGSGGELTAELSSRVKYFGLPFKAARESVGKFKSQRPGPTAVTTPAQPTTNSMRLRYEARAFASQKTFDVVHAHFGPNGVRAVRLRARGALSGPIITSFYGYDVTRHWARGGYGELFSHGDWFIALSETMRNQLVDLGANPERVVIHRLGVNVHKFGRGKNSGDRLELVSIARLVEKKGIEFAIAAVAQLVKQNVRLRYTIVGDGPQKSSLEQLASRHGIAAHVEFAGARTQDDVTMILSRSDILLAPSVTAIDGDTEGTPVAILEAQAAGIPVVSTFHSAIPEIVSDGVSGFLVDERDAQTLADRIARLASDAALRNRMGEAGRAFVEENHDIQKLNGELVQIYEGVIMAQS